MDYAVVVDMARNMAAGTDFPTFFYGQAYMGSFEPAISALLCALLGPHPFWVCMGSALLGIATLWAVMRIARRLGGETGACIALALTICGGAHWIHFTVSPRGGYALASLLCLLAVYFGSAVDFIDMSTGRIRIGIAVAFGLATGLAFWNFWIALPAFVAAGAMLLLRYRASCLSWRLFAPAALAFFVGSAPWWLWTIHNGGGAFDMNSGVLRPPGLAAAHAIAKVVIPRFFGFMDDYSQFWRNLSPWPLVAICIFSAADAMFVRNAQRCRFLATVFIYVFLFFLAYAFTSFGAANIARYFVHFVPTFAVAGGAALGAALHAKGITPLRRNMSVVILAMWAIFTAPAVLRATEKLMAGLDYSGRHWAAAMNAAAEDHALFQPAFADFPLFGANWVTDRRLCFVSPLRWRYDPYLRRLEQAQAPAVIDDSQAFGEFCRATMGGCRTRNISNLAVTDKITAPPALRELPGSDIAQITIADKKEVFDRRIEFIDDDISSTVTLRSSNEPVDITLAKQGIVGGVTLILTYSRRLCGIRAETIDADGNVMETLARCNPIGGWFWSGPRQFMFGPDYRLELRWKPLSLSRLRLVFEGVDPSSSADRFVATVADLRLLSGEALPPVDAEAVGRAISVERASMPEARIHAGRWLGTKIGADPDPALTFGRESGSLAIPAVCQYVTLDTAHGAFAVLNGGAADAAENTFRTSGVDYARHDAGGCAIFAIAPADGKSKASRLRFYGGRIFRDTARTAETTRLMSPAITFGGAWCFQMKSSLPTEIIPGQVVSLDFTLSAANLRRCSARKPLMAFVHALRDGKLLFQGIATIDTSLAVLPADAPTPISISIPIEVPRDVSPGPVEIMLCVKKHGGALRMKPCGEGINFNKRRAIIGNIKVANP